MLSPRFLPQVNHPFSLQHVEFLLHFPRNFSRRSLVPWGNSMRQPKTSKTAVPATSSLHLSSLPPRIPLKLTTRTPAPTAAVTAAGVTAGLSRTSCSRDRVLACSRVCVLACLLVNSGQMSSHQKHCSTSPLKNVFVQWQAAEMPTPHPGRFVRVTRGLFRACCDVEVAAVPWLRFRSTCHRPEARLQRR